MLTTVGRLKLACVAVYLVPRTAVVGAGGLFVWTGLYPRDERVRALLPITGR